MEPKIIDEEMHKMIDDLPEFRAKFVIKALLLTNRISATLLKRTCELSEMFQE